MRFSAPLADWHHVPGCSCSKTSLGCSLRTAGTLWPESFKAWPRAATWDATGLYELLTPAHPTAERACSSLLKTPTAQLAINGGSQHPDKRRAGGHGPTLADQIEHEITALLPTPVVTDAKGARNATAGRSPGSEHHSGTTLTDAVTLLPTPRATDGTKGGPNQRGSSGDLMLPSAVMALLPTPSASNPNDCEPVESWQARAETLKDRHGNGNGAALALSLLLEPAECAA